jgi:hypothetical protein
MAIILGERKESKIEAKRKSRVIQMGGKAAPQIMNNSSVNNGSICQPCSNNLPTLTETIHSIYLHYSHVCTNAHARDREVYKLGVSPACPGRAFNSGWRALTTMLMFGRKSDSYCTHKAATAAIYKSRQAKDLLY